MRALLMNTFISRGASWSDITHSVELYLYTSKAKQASKLYHFICFQYYYEKTKHNKINMHIHWILGRIFPYANQSRVGLDSLIPTFIAKMTRPKR